MFKNYNKVWNNSFRKNSIRANNTHMTENNDYFEAENAEHDHDQEKLGIECDENKIYFYDDITPKQALKLNKLIRNLDVEMQYVKLRLKLDKAPPIILRISSRGGEVMAALSIAETIMSCKTEVHTYVDGEAASAATILSVVGSKRYIGKHSYMLLHQVRGGYVGTRNEINDMTTHMNNLQEEMEKIYLSKTKLTKEQLNEIINKELHINSKKCLELGLVDAIEE